jgi:ABC-type branched-subunit amino acid transport system substrate-binding protein
MPLANPDFAPFLQRARNSGPDTLFVFPANQAAIFAKQFLERGMDKSGIRLVGTGDLTDDDELPGMTDAELGIITAHHYSALHDSPLNKNYVENFLAAYGKRPNYHSIAGYDGMHLIYEALKRSKLHNLVKVGKCEGTYNKGASLALDECFEGGLVVPIVSYFWTIIWRWSALPASTNWSLCSSW